MTKWADGQKTVKMSTIPAKRSLQQRIEDLSRSVEYRRMTDLEDRQAVLKLRKDAYSRYDGDVDQWVEATASDRSESNSETIGLFIAGKLAGSFKVTVATSEYPDCQSAGFFPQQVADRLSSGKTIIDPGGFVSDPKAALDYPELPFLLMKIPVMACLHFDADECFSVVRPDHAPFYRRVFSAEMVAGPKYYEPLQVEAVMMVSMVDVIRENVLTRYPFWRASYLQMRQLFGAPQSMPAIAQRMTAAA